MNKRMRTALAIIMIAGAVLTACGITDAKRFKVAERFNGGCVYVDTETGVGYGCIYGNSTIFPLYDADGNLYRPNGWRDYE